MLDGTWEKWATRFANVPDADSFVTWYNAALHALVNPSGADANGNTIPVYKHDKVNNTNVPANVIFARDTRASGSRLVKCLIDAFQATNVNYTDFKLATTPQLHYYVRCINTKGSQEEYGEPSEKGYYEKLSSAFKQVMEGVKPKGGLTVDCANGVGGPKLRELIKYLPKATEGGLDITIVNEDVFKPDMLNVQASGSC